MKVEIIAVVLGLVVSAPGLVMASEVLRVQIDETPTVGLSPGSGVTISFPERRIRKIWLDDSSWVLVNSDGCLDGLPKTCRRSEATFLHLRRIKPLSIQGMPYTGVCLLTVVTSGDDNEQNLKVSTIRVVPRNSTRYSVVEVVSSSPVDLGAVERGRDVVVRRGLIHKGDRLWMRVERFIALAKRQPLSTAAAKAGISMELVERLSFLGSLSGVVSVHNQSR